jgi:hypothetical protein
LQPLFKWESSYWKHTVNVIANILGLTDKLAVEHQYPRRPSFDSVSEIVANMQAAKAAGASQFVMNIYDDMLSQALNTDVPYAQKKRKVEALFDPFYGKPPEIISTLMNDSEVPVETKVLYKNLKEILLITEMAYGEKNQSSVTFYDLRYKQQKELIDATLQTFLQSAEEQKQAATQFKLEAIKDEEDTKEEEDSKAA